MSLTAWRKSSFSAGGETNCVEVAWRKSSFSSTPEGNCVEVAVAATAVAVRDSKNTAPTLTFSPHAWRDFLSVTAD
jgi:hypothetical protein